MGRRRSTGGGGGDGGRVPRVHESTRLSSWLVALETGGCEVKMFEDDLEDSG